MNGVAVPSGDAVEVGPPLPRTDPLSAFFWEGAQRHQLLILRCLACGHHIHWPRPVCRYCLSESLAPAVMSGHGVVYSYTVARQAFHPWFADRLPYVIAVVELVEEAGLRMLTNVIDCAPSDVAVGAPVEVAYRAMTPELTLPMFRLRAE